MEKESPREKLEKQFLIETAWARQDLHAWVAIAEKVRGWVAGAARAERVGRKEGGLPPLFFVLIYYMYIYIFIFIFFKKNASLLNTCFLCFYGH